MKKDLKGLYKQYTKKVLPHENAAGAVDGTDVQAPGYDSGGKVKYGSDMVIPSKSNNAVYDPQTNQFVKDTEDYDARNKAIDEMNSLSMGKDDEYFPAETGMGDVQVRNRYNSGGKVGSGERFASLENKLSHQKGVTDPAALAASIGRKKYGNKKMNKMAEAHMDEGGPVLDPTLVNNFVKGFKGYDQGGSVTSDDNDPFQKLRALYNQYMNPQPAPSPVDVRNQQYQNIRDSQQRDRNQSASDYADPSAPAPGYDDGGKVQPEDQQVDANNDQLVNGNDLEGQYINEEENAAPGESELPTVDPNAISDEQADEDAEALAKDEEDQEKNDVNAKDQSEEDQSAEQTGVEDRTPAQAQQDMTDDKSAAENAPVPLDKDNSQVSVDGQDVSAAQPNQSSGPSIMDQLAQAQQQVRSNANMNDLQKWAAMAGARTPGVNPAQALAVIKDQGRNQNLPIEQLEQRIQLQGEDPNSAVSTVMRNYLKNKGFQVPNDASSNDMLKVAPFLAKDKQLAFELQKFNLQQAQKVNEDQLNRENALKVAGINSHRLDALINNKTELQDNTRMEKLGHDLTEEFANGRGAFGIAAKNKQSIDNVEALLGNGNIDLNTLDNRQVYETAKVLDRVLSQSGATVEGSKNLTPQTAQAHMAKAMEYITNRRQGANAGDFLKNMQSTFQREKQQATKQLNAAKIKRLAPDQDLFQKYPDRMSNILAANGFGTMPDFNQNNNQSQKQPQQVQTLPSGNGVSHSSAPIGTISNGRVKTQNGWIPKNQ